MNELPVITQTEIVRRAHCTYCGGKGANMQSEWIVSPIGTKYRIPLSHATCKRSVLSLSLSLDPIPSSSHKKKGRGRKKE